MKHLLIGIFFLLTASCASLGSIDNSYPTSSYVKVNILNHSGNISGWGSGVVINRDEKSSVILTAAHVCDSPKFEVSTLRGKNYPAHVLYVQNEVDLCLLWVPSLTSLPTVRLGSHPKIGDRVYAISSPLGFRSALDGMVPIVEGMYVGHYTLQKKVDPFTRAGVVWEVFNQPLAPGSSGGMVVNEKMELISITVRGFKHRHLNGGVAFDDIKRFLDNARKEGLIK